MVNCNRWKSVEKLFYFIFKLCFTEFQEEIDEEKPMNKENMDSINLHNVYAVSPLYNRWSWLLNNNNDEQQPTSTMSNISSTDCKLRGFQLHSYDRMEENILQEFLVVFQNNLPDQIERWYQLLSNIIAECMKIFVFFYFSKKFIQ